MRLITGADPEWLREREIVSQAGKYYKLISVMVARNRSSSFLSGSVQCVSSNIIDASLVRLFVLFWKNCEFYDFDIPSSARCWGLNGFTIRSIMFIVWEMSFESRTSLTHDLLLENRFWGIPTGELEQVLKMNQDHCARTRSVVLSGFSLFTREHFDAG